MENQGSDTTFGQKEKHGLNALHSDVEERRGKRDGEKTDDDYNDFYLEYRNCDEYDENIERREEMGNVFWVNDMDICIPRNNPQIERGIENETRLFLTDTTPDFWSSERRPM